MLKKIKEKYKKLKMLDCSQLRRSLLGRSMHSYLKNLEIKHVKQTKTNGK